MLFHVNVNEERLVVVKRYITLFCTFACQKGGQKVVKITKMYHKGGQQGSKILP
jgi:hypothetical protein